MDASIKAVNERLTLNFKRQQSDLRELQDSQKLIKEDQLKHHDSLKDILERLEEKVNALATNAPLTSQVSAPNLPHAE